MRTTGRSSAPPASGRQRTAVVAVLSMLAALLAVLQAGPAHAAGTDLAAGKTMSAGSYTQSYTPANANDGNQATYWESANNAFPQWLQVDLGATTSVNQLVLQVPVTNWAARTQTLSVQGSIDGSNFTTIVASASYTFDPATNSTVTINFAATGTRYLRTLITANTGWPAAQISEFKVYGPSTTDTTPPTAPGTLTYTQPQSGQIALSWGASTDNVGVTAYDVYRNGALAVTVGGTTLTWTDSQPATATVSYYVKARDAAGNVSPAGNTVTRTGTGGSGTNLALHKPITGTPYTYTYAPANANDGDLTTYFEGSSYPSRLTVQLGANADVTSVVVKLNPASAWSTRTQTIQVLGREQSATDFTSISAAQTYTFDPNTGNTVTIPVSATVADVELSITGNSGAPGGQVGELQVIGTPAPNPDLTVSASSWSPSAPVETDSVTASATVANVGTAASPASNVNFYLGSTKVGTAPVGALAAGASAKVSAVIGTQTAGTYQLTAKVDEAKSFIELGYDNNTYTNPNNLVVAPVQSSDLVGTVDWSPNNPSAGSSVKFSVTLKNQGTVASGSGSHGVTLTLLDSTGKTLTTLTGSYTGTIAAGAAAPPVSLGSWTAVNGKYTVHTVVAVDPNELSVKQANNTSDTSLFVGRGANMPYDVYQGEDGQIGGGAAVVGPNRTIGDLAGEASGRKAVTLNTTGSYVQWTTRASTNTLVTRFSIPDAPGGGGDTATLNVYVDGTFLQTITLNSKYAWLYGAETGPGNNPSAGSPRHIYDEAHVMLDRTVPQGSVIKLQKDSSNTSQYAIDYINTEQVAPVANPDPNAYLTPAGFGQQDVQKALDTVRQDTTGKLVGVYLPAGQYQTTGKFNVYGKAVKVVGAGPWYTQFNSPATSENSDVGWSVQSSADGSSFQGFGWFGNYTSRIDGPGKVFDLTDVSDITVDDVWIEHQVCAIWGTHVNGLKATNMRIRDTFADGINLTNGSQNNLVSNDEARSTGDDSFALFAAQDHNSSDLTNNTFQNLTALTPWRAAGVAVYGGENNTLQNLYVADTLTYSGITISSLNFGYPFQGFGTQPTTVQNVSLVRDGGHFWGGQVFPAIWLFSATQPFQGIRVNDTDIVDPTYAGIMFQTDYVNGTALNPIKDTVFTDTSITGAQQSGDAYDAKSGYGIWANPMPESGQGPAVGSATFNHLTQTNNHIDVYNPTTTFTINVNP
ncbi:discoidin domain-containing protein [Streptomyces sp. NPDC052109]|uniref:discoidin domain-containing protein n=1 Tax=Streptomyces sp. NPDC052109 TaxID=3155527 RepID=UPI003418DA18